MQENNVIPCECCGADCNASWREDEDQPCWGQVNPADVPSGDEEWAHYCEGHMPEYWGDEYKSQPTIAPLN